MQLVFNKNEKNIMELTKMNGKIRVNYVNETYRDCLTNKINNNQPQPYHPRIKLVNRILSKRKHLAAKFATQTTLKRKLNDIENNIEDINEETDSNFSLKRRKTDETELELPLAKNIDIIEPLNYSNDFEMNERVLWLIADNYHNLNEWKLISLGLGLEISDLQIIEAKYLISDDLKECFYQCLLKWRLKQPENCYLSYFLNVLRTKLNKKSSFINKLKDFIQTTSDKPKNESHNKLKLYLNNLEHQKSTCVNEHKLKMKLDENHLWLTSGYIFQEWKAISRHLNLTELDLFSIETKHMQSDGIRECCYQSLLKWSQFYYEQTSLENLCLTLIQIKLNLYAKQLLAEFCF